MTNGGTSRIASIIDSIDSLGFFWYFKRIFDLTQVFSIFDIPHGQVSNRFASSVARALTKQNGSLEYLEPRFVVGIVLIANDYPTGAHLVENIVDAEGSKEQ